MDTMTKCRRLQTQIYDYVPEGFTLLCLCAHSLHSMTIGNLFFLGALYLVIHEQFAGVRYCLRVGPEIAQEEVDHLFGVSDDNEDGILSFNEVLEHHDTFVGSEATDYGDHLHNIHHFEDEL